MSRAHTVETANVTGDYRGHVVTHDVLDHDRRVLIPKGSALDDSMLARLRGAANVKLHLLELGPGDLHEDAAGQRVARAVIGSGVRVEGPSQSRYDLIAEHRGLLRVDPTLLRAINQVRDMTVYTMIDRQPVTAGTVVASVKITPIAVAEERVAEVERLCREAEQAVLEVRPFISRRVGVLAVDEVGADVRPRFEAAMTRRLRWYGASLIDIRYVDSTVAQVADALRGLLDLGVELLLTAGGNIIDPLDPIEQALEAIDARIVHRGAPTRGSMCWLAHAGDVPIVNLASARMWIGSTAGDLILPMLMAGEDVKPDDIIDLGYGGLPGSAVRLRYPKFDEDGA